MSDLTEQLRGRAYSGRTFADIASEAADALEAAEAKLATIDALHRKVVRLTTGDVTVCPTCDEDTYGLWPCDTARILHPEEEQ